MSKVQLLEPEDFARWDWGSLAPTLGDDGRNLEQVFEAFIAIVNGKLEDSCIHGAKTVAEVLIDEGEFTMMNWQKDGILISFGAESFCFYGKLNLMDEMSAHTKESRKAFVKHLRKLADKIENGSWE